MLPLSDARVCVLGLGPSGLSAVRYLQRHGVACQLMDSRAHPPALDEIKQHFPALPCQLGMLDQQALLACTHVFVSPGLPLDTPVLATALQQGVQLLGELDLFCAEAQAPICAVTGSNGKSTVVSLLTAMLRSAGQQVILAGNIGTPMLDVLQQPVPDVYVLELSSFQLERAEPPRVQLGCVLNLSMDHLDHHKSFHAYAAAKQRVFTACGIAVVSHMADGVLPEDPALPCLGFALTPPEQHGDYGCVGEGTEACLVCGDEVLLPVAELPMSSRIMQLNVLAAWAMAEHLDASRQACRDAVAAFTGLPHRMQWLGRAHGVRWCDDSKGTNVGATLAALQSMPGPFVLLAGGLGKGQDFAPLAAGLAQVRAVIVYGQDAQAIRQCLPDHVLVQVVATLDEAVHAACQITRTGDSLLLSPACASLDQFSSYQERGACFQAALARYQVAEQQAC